MTRVVLDTNILASGAVASPDGTLATIIDAWQDHPFEVIVSQAILAELERTLASPYFATRLSAQNVEACVNLVRSSAVVQPLITLLRAPLPTPRMMQSWRRLSMGPWTTS
jgi:putative PIN family toxin of toxin-antitoxin system